MLSTLAPPTPTTKRRDIDRGRRKAPRPEGEMIRIDMLRQDTNHPDRRRRHQGRASCEVAGRRFETEGPAPIYKLTTLLWLHGHGGVGFEVWADRNPFGKPGGLALRGKVRNRAILVKGKPSFTRKAKPDSDFMPDEREVIARSAGTVVDVAGVPAASGLPGAVCVTRPADGPEHPQGQDRAPAAFAPTPRPEAA